MERHGRDVVAAIQKALDVPASQLPRYPRQKQKTVPTVVSNRIPGPSQLARGPGAPVENRPSLICSKATMGALAERRPLKAEDLADLNGLKQWQRKAFGKEILATLAESTLNAVPKRPCFSRPRTCGSKGCWGAGRARRGWSSPTRTLYTVATWTTPWSLAVRDAYRLKGFSTLRFNFRGTGGSGRPPRQGDR